MLRVSKQANGEPEVFYSLQGEGPNTGAPSVFLRLATCNLACSWCATKYTWDWEHYDYDLEVVTLEPSQVEARILRFGCRRSIITGGEPLLQQRELAPLVASLKDQEFHFEVETNGTIAPQPELVRDIDQWNVSPKLATSCNTKDRRDQGHAMDALCRLPNAYFKFVVTEPRDVDEVCTLRDKYGLHNQRIILMPEGTTPGEIQRRSPWVSEACVKEGFRFSTRLHILLWGDKRGR